MLFFHIVGWAGWAGPQRQAAAEVTACGSEGESRKCDLTLFLVVMSDEGDLFLK